MNFTEGYNLTLEDDGIHYRISAKPYNPVKGTLRGAPDNLELLEQALESDEWRVGIAEAVARNGNHELHVNVTHLEATVQEGVIESVTHEDAGCWNCVYERQHHPARGDFYRRVLQCNGDRDARVVRAS